MAGVDWLWLRTFSRFVASLLAALFLSTSVPHTTQARPTEAAVMEAQVVVATVDQLVESKWALAASHQPPSEIVEAPVHADLALVRARTGRGPAPRAPPIG